MSQEILFMRLSVKRELYSHEINSTHDSRLKIHDANHLDVSGIY
jgi:hypothetical protein